MADTRAPVNTEIEALARLAWAAVDRLYQHSLFMVDDGGVGCCPRCCSGCAALYYLEQVGRLDTVLAAVNPGPRSVGESGMIAAADGTVRRAWMYRAWNGKAGRGCGPAVHPRSGGVAPDT